jgi:predicted transcriptional regulator
MDSQSRRLQLINEIINFIGYEKKTINEVCTHLGITNTLARSIMQTLMNANIIQKTELIKSKNQFVYSKVHDCLIADMLYPSAKEVEAMLKPMIKSKRIVTVEQGTSKARTSSYNRDVYYSQSYYGTIYEGE